MTNTDFGNGLTSNITTECGLPNFVNQITNFTFVEVTRRTNSCFKNLLEIDPRIRVDIDDLRGSRQVRRLT
ncbi:hypothetical protein YC2023_083640 [Brassica napus]